MISVTFFDIKNYEEEFFKKYLSSKYDMRFFNTPLLSDTQLSDAVKKSDVLSVFTSSRLCKKVLEQFKNLKLIVARSVGYSHIDTVYCDLKNIPVVTAPHYGDYTVAEFSFALLLDLIRHVSKAASDVKTGELKPEYSGRELFGKTIGIIGTGAIGSKSVGIASGFSMKILASDPIADEVLVQKYNVQYLSVDELCRHSDVIMLHAPLFKNNYHLLNEEKFALMKNSAVIVNTARGELIDTNALYKALVSGKLAGAALDVVECEEMFVKESDSFDCEVSEDNDCIKKTLLNHVLRNLKNVIVTPHIAYDTYEATRRICNMSMDNLTAFSVGKPLDYIINLHN